MFQFFYFSTSCSTNSGYREDVQFNGCQLRANDAASDFVLLEFNQIPALNSGLRYAGWSRQTTNIQSTTILHHPHGDVMKITRDNDPPTFQTFLGAQCWHLIVDNGTTEGGSSGSPYFDQNHRIIGQHDGIDDGNLSICNQISKFGGRFDVSWTGGGTNSTRLSNWLDPSNSGATTTNTTDISLLTPISFSISGDDNFCTTSNNYTIPGLPAGATVTWSVSPSGVVTINSPNSTQTTLSKNYDGTFTLSATIGNLCGRADVTVNKNNIASGFPDYGGPMGADTAWANSNYHYWVSLPLGFPPVTSYYWQVPSGWTILSGQGTNELYVNTGTTGGPVEVDIIACGVERPTYKYVEIGSGDWWPDFVNPGDLKNKYDVDLQNKFRIAPNPADNSITVSLADNPTFKGKTSVTTVVITDILGVIRKQLRYAPGTRQAQINVSDLRPGMYIIEINNGKEIKRQTLIIQR